jgi:hypothetical protein
MNRLTPEERRRIWLAQQRARETALTRLAVAPTTGMSVPQADHAVLRRLAKAAMIAALLAAGLLASQALEFNPPATLVEALLPRL